MIQFGFILVCLVVLSLRGSAFLAPQPWQWRWHLPRRQRFTDQNSCGTSSVFSDSRQLLFDTSLGQSSIAPSTEPESTFPHRHKISNATQSALNEVHTYQKPRQVRRIPTKRKPRNYWQSTTNLRNELIQFWTSHNVPIDRIYPGQPPPIPSEYILNFFERNDLRGAIASNGGREHVSYMLGGAKIIPGRWKDAMQLEEVKYLLPLMSSNAEPSKDAIEQQHSTLENGMISDQNGGYLSSIMNRTLDDEPRLIDLVKYSNQTGCANATTMSEKEFWTQEKAILELYRYLERYKKHKQRPSVWMPQLIELSHEGYSQLFNACRRYNKLPCVSVYSKLSEKTSIENMAGLVPYKEWRFFDSQLQLFIELKQYLDLYHNGSEEVFPDPNAVKSNGHANLYALIRIHGGKVLLAQKLNMKLYRGEIKSCSSMNIEWGPITLDFAIRILNFVRSEFMTMSPPLAYPMISMPLEQDLLRRGQNDLASLIVQYGGYENIARRLGLAYFDGKSKQMDGTLFKGARYLWKSRNAPDTSIIATKTYTKTAPVNKKKRKGVAWTKDVVVEELHSYTKANMTKRSLAAVWMPRFSQLDEDDRTDLKNAISRNGGQMVICKAAGLIPYAVWTKFVSFRELVTRLLEFNVDELPNDNGDAKYTVPTPKLIAKEKHAYLLELIRQFGGTNAVKDALSINGRRKLSSLSTIVELTEFIHSDMMSMEPPFSHEMQMPTEEQLSQVERDDLVAAIHSIGGFKVIASIIPGLH